MDFRDKLITEYKEKMKSQNQIIRKFNPETDELWLIKLKDGCVSWSSNCSEGSGHGPYYLFADTEEEALKLFKSWIGEQEFSMLEDY